MATDVAYVEADEAHHPGSSIYVRVAVILAIVTALEVAVYYIPSLHGVMVPLLLALSTIKFLFVVSFFMHLKFERKMLVASVALGFIAVFALFYIIHFDAQLGHPGL